MTNILEVCFVDLFPLENVPFTKCFVYFGGPRGWQSLGLLNSNSGMFSISTISFRLANTVSSDDDCEPNSDAGFGSEDHLFSSTSG